jgi:hypothetical protein
MAVKLVRGGGCVLWVGTLLPGINIKVNGGAGERGGNMQYARKLFFGIVSAL